MMAATKLLFGLIFCFSYINCERFPECIGRSNRSYVTSNNRKKDCRSFIFCDGENSFEGLCPEGLAFNPEQLACGPKESFQCKNDDNGISIQSESFKVDNSKNLIVTAKHHLNPTLRPSTPKSSPTKTNSRKNSNRPIPTRRKTSLPPKMPSKKPSTTAPNTITTRIHELCLSKSVGRLSYPNDCRYYFRCMRGVLNKRECPEYSLFYLI
ncbi:uncharacterized protein LOC129920205 [Episyrphus balteatus]|uniref:uncharacterized protein LOC129920205 n=1 Tax=Episyrphus balteatus TaxID=286459 RepID=UPI002484FA0F|nr:uncharacterized protein LOC129920205 [Episyrphus balteatus]